MKLVIESVENGYRLYDEGERFEGEAPVNCVFQVSEADLDDLNALQELTYCLWENLGYFGSKHDARRLFARIEVQGEDNE